MFWFQFEAGLLTTSKVVYAIYLYSEHINKAPAITEVKEDFIIIVIINIIITDARDFLQVKPDAL